MLGKVLPSSCSGRGILHPRWRRVLCCTRAVKGAAHVPVLLEKVLDAFDPIDVHTFVDGTLGAGGHTCAMLERHGELSRSIGIDRDLKAHELAGERVRQLGVGVRSMIDIDSIDDTTDVGETSVGDGRWLIPVHGNFSRMKSAVHRLHGCGLLDEDTVDGILLDLGVSSMQLDMDERGFSFQKDGPLDMRMDTTRGVSAETAVNTWSEATLGQVFRDFGEERYWKSIARRIVERRMERPIMTTKELVDVIGVPGGMKNRRNRKGRQGKEKHPATRVFQALRIAINEELDSVSRVVPDAIDMLKPGGRLAIITFHSLEDRIVKWAFREAAGMAPSDSNLPSYCMPFDSTSDARVKIITRRPICPTPEEEADNVRSRSAKLRVVEKL
jgi:16S rRNA (cytosine1402-N4)-methyltransferase